MKRPSIVGGEIQVIEVPGSDALVEYTQSLANRAELVRRRKVEPEEDNMLKITSDGRKASLFNGPPEAGLASCRTKVDALVEQVWSLYRDAHDDRATQLIFCDLYTPKGSPAKRGRPTTDTDEGAPVSLTDGERILTEGIYGEIKRRLVNAGMLASQIEYVHDATTDERKAALYARVNDGSCRVLIGSTTKMGTGLNVQRRIIGLHHLTAPWRPDWLEQANGRGRRQGNMWDAIHIMAYVTQKSYDAAIWQILEQKSRMISQIAAGTYSGRTAEDIGDIVLTASMCKAIALGNPAILDKIKLETELAQEEKRYLSWAGQQARSQRDIERLPTEIAMQEAEIAALRVLADDLTGKPDFSCKLRSDDAATWQTYDSLPDAENRLQEMARSMHKLTAKDSLLVGEYRGLVLRMRRAWGAAELVAEHRGGAVVSAQVLPGGTFRGIEYQIGTSPGRLLNMTNALDIARRRLETLRARDDRWPGKDRVTQLLTQYRTACDAVAQDGIVDAQHFRFRF